MSASFKRGDALAFRQRMSDENDYSMTRILPALFITKKTHDQDVFSDLDGLGTRYPSRHESLEIAHFLLRPQTYHLAWITSAIATSEAILACHIAIAVLEHKNRCLVYFERKVCGGRGECMINICLNTLVGKDVGIKKINLPPFPC